MLVRYTVTQTIQVPDGSRILDREDDHEGFACCVELPTGERIRVNPVVDTSAEHPDGYIEEEPLEDGALGVRMIEGGTNEVREIQESDLMMPLDFFND